MPFVNGKWVDAKKVTQEQASTAKNFSGGDVKPSVPQIQGNIYKDKTVPGQVLEMAKAQNLNTNAKASNGQLIQTNTPTTPNIYDPTQDITKLKEASQQKLIADLNNSRQSALSNLNREQSTIAPQYQQKKMQANTQSQNGARNFAEFMAQRGLSRSGVSALGEINRTGALQRTMGDLGRQEQSAFDDIARRRTYVENNYLNSLVSGQAGIEADAMGKLISARQNYDNTLYSRGRDKIADERYNDTTAYNRNQDTLNRERQNRIDFLNDEKMTQEAEIRRWEYEQARANSSNDKLLAELKVQEARQKLTQINNEITKQGIELKYLPQQLQADIASTNALTQQRLTPDKPSATEEKNNSFADDYTALKSLSVEDAQRELTDGASDYIRVYGLSGYNQLWNNVLGAAIDSGNYDISKR